MRFLIVEDELVNRKLLQKILSPYGDCDIAVDGDEAIQAFSLALEESVPYDLICMDIMMPNTDGQKALLEIRNIEEEAGITGIKETKVIMVTALDNPKTVIDAFYKGGATSYVVKPIDKLNFLNEIRNIGLVLSNKS